MLQLSRSLESPFPAGSYYSYYVTPALHIAPAMLSGRVFVPVLIGGKQRDRFEQTLSRMAGVKPMTYRKLSEETAFTGFVRPA